MYGVFMQQVASDIYIGLVFIFISICSIRRSMCSYLGSKRYTNAVVVGDVGNMRIEKPTVWSNNYSSNTINIRSSEDEHKAP